MSRWFGWTLGVVSLLLYAGHANASIPPETELEPVSFGVETGSSQDVLSSGGQHERPGDGNDDGAVVLERRETDRSYHSLAWTHPPRIENHQGSVEEPLCLCDLTLVLWNETGPSPLGPIQIIDSSYVMIDNLTVYGGALIIEGSANVTIRESNFIDAKLLGIYSRDVHVENTTFLGQWGLARSIPNQVVPGCQPAGAHCYDHGIEVISGDRWSIGYNYMDGVAALRFHVDVGSLEMRHNTIYESGTVTIGTELADFSWNLVRTHERYGIAVIGSEYARIANNSIGLSQGAEQWDDWIRGSTNLLIACAWCIIESNDFLGYCVSSPAFVIDQSEAIAYGNFWGIPKAQTHEMPPCVRGPLSSEEPRTLPNHEVSFAFFLNAQDLHYYAEDFAK